jgi:hypothetical protein
LLAVLAGLVLAAPHILARPHVLALPVMVAWVAGLVRAVDTHRPPSWWLLPLMTLWANLHGSFIFGLAIVGATACDAVWNAAVSQRWRVAQGWCVFGMLALAAACLNAYGPEIFLAAFRVINLGKALSGIAEWRPQDFGQLTPYELIVLAGFGLALYRGVKLPLPRLIILLGLVHLSLSHVRHADLLGTLAPIFLARPLAGQLGASATDRFDDHARFGAWLSAAAAAILIVLTSFATTRADMAPPANITPSAAIRSTNLANDGPLLNDYAFGGYLVSVGIAPFIDGRTELYGEKFNLRYDRALELRDVPDFLRLLQEYRIGATLLKPDTPAISLLDRLPEWQRVYADDVAVVHRRRGALPPQN